MNQYEAIQNFPSVEPYQEENSPVWESSIDNDDYTLGELREALIYKLGDSETFVRSSNAVKASPIRFIKEQHDSDFFSIQSADNATMLEGEKEWNKECAIVIESGKYEIYYDGSLITTVESTMQQTYDKLTGDGVVRLFRSMDELF